MARAGHEPGTAGLRVRCADHSATLPPKIKIKMPPKFHQGIYCSFQVVKGPTRGLQEDSDVAESDACSEVGSEEDDGVEERLELILDPLSCQETSENE